jgi:hypothetical protein
MRRHPSDIQRRKICASGIDEFLPIEQLAPRKPIRQTPSPDPPGLGAASPLASALVFVRSVMINTLAVAHGTFPSGPTIFANRWHQYRRSTHLKIKWIYIAFTVNAQQFKRSHEINVLLGSKSKKSHSSRSIQSAGVLYLRNSSFSII